MELAGNMTKNTGKGYRKGSIRDRTQVQNPKTDNWTKRDAESGRFMDVKEDRQAFKGVTKETSLADKKMMRAWKTISENRNGVKRKH